MKYVQFASNFQLFFQSQKILFLKNQRQKKKKLTETRNWHFHNVINNEKFNLFFSNIFFSTNFFFKEKKRRL